MINDLWKGDFFMSKVNRSPGMMWPTTGMLAVAVLVLGWPLAGLAEEAAWTTLPSMEKAPLVDGKINRDEWSDALALGTFLVRDGAKMPGTEAWIAMDEEALYVAFRCLEPTPAKIRTQTLQYEENQPVWNDDSVEVYFDPGNTGKSIFRLVINAEGTTFSERVVNLQKGVARWNPEATVRTWVGEDRWEVEVAIPLASTGHLLQKGEVFSMNVGRTRFGGNHGAQYSSLLRGGHFLFPEHYRQLLVEGPLRSEDLNLVSTRRGPFFPDEEGQWEFEINPEAGVSGTLKAALASGEVVSSVGEGKQLFSVAIPKGRAQEMRALSLTFKDTEVYAAEYAVEDTKLPPRVSKTENPLFKELLEPFPDGLSKDGMMGWWHELGGHTSFAFARRTGREVSQNLPMKAYGRDRTILVMRARRILDEPWPALFLDNGVKTVADLRPILPETDPETKVRKWFQDPAHEERYLESTRELIEWSKKRKYLWGFFAGDELWEQNESALRSVLRQRVAGDKVVDDADREIREKYGHGVFGLPVSVDDTNPYRWIATRRWEVDRMVATAEKVRAMMKKEAPHLKFVSWDNYPGQYPRGVRKWGKVFDVITGQLYPYRNKDLEEFGFEVKLLADLSGAREIWPCPHFEHYGGSFTPDEVEELLSQSLRNGATGFHIYAADTINLRAGKGYFVTERLGAPERWEVVRQVIDLLKEPVRVKQPVPDTAIFYSNTSYQGQSTLRKTREAEFLYTVLGPRLGGAFRFIDDLLFEEEKFDLSQYKAIYIPYLPIADDREYDALEAYVRAGGLLVVCDPMAFRNRSDATERKPGGLVPPLASLKEVRGEVAHWQGEGKADRLSSIGSRYPLVAGEGASVLAAYPSGEPSVIETRLGKGRVVYFSANPLQGVGVVTDPGWIHLFASLQASVHAAKDEPVWRFRLPHTVQREEPLPAGVCVTENSLVWKLGVFTDVANAGIGGSYLISRSDLRKQEPAGQKIAFEEGRLTDRRKGAVAPNKSNPEDYTLAWELDSPVEVTLEFSRAVPLSLVRAYHSGTLPAGSVAVSHDGKEWEEVGQWKKQHAADVVGHPKAREMELKVAIACKEIPLPEKSARFLKLHFTPSPGDTLTLVELDAWAANEQKKESPKRRRKGGSSLPVTR